MKRIITMADKTTLDSLKTNADKICNVLKNYPKAVRYGVRVDKNNPDPYERIEYMYDATGMTPAKMDYENERFDYGSWEDVWFVKENKPVMLNYDGTEAYELDPNDYNKKLDGSDSDISNSSFGGNAMSRIPLVYVKMWEDSSYEYYIVSNVKYDDTYKAIAHTKEDGSIKENLYLAMFEGSNYSSKLRSISGSTNIYEKTMTDEITYAKANGSGWYTRTWGQRMLINILLMIMSKNDNSQEAFGKGLTNTYDLSASPTYGMKTSGQLNDKGQFFGYNDETHAVKVFHMENWWGNQKERISGLMTVSGVLKATFTGPYNTTGDGCENTGITYSSSIDGYGSTTKCTSLGRFVTACNGSSSTYTCDYYASSSSTLVPAVGSYCSSGSSCGSWCVVLNYSVSDSLWFIGASLSFL